MMKIKNKILRSKNTEDTEYGSNDDFDENFALPSQEKKLSIKIENRYFKWIIFQNVIVFLLYYIMYLTNKYSIGVHKRPAPNFWTFVYIAHHF